MVAALGSVSSRECLGAPAILATTEYYGRAETPTGWKMSLSAKNAAKEYNKF